MRFDFYNVLMNPFFLTFITLFLGVWFGGWKRMGHMQLGIGGALFVGIFLGWLTHFIALSLPKGHTGYEAAQKILTSGTIPSQMSSFVLILFIVAIGLLASRDLKMVLRKYGIQFIVLGIVITFIGACLSYLSMYIIPNSNVYEASGIYTGALTSSPGLGMAMESSQKHVSSLADKYETLSENQKHEFFRLLGLSENPTSETLNSLDHEEVMAATENVKSYVGTGYAVAYPFGMIAVILAIIIIPKIFRIDIPAELEAYRREIAQTGDGKTEESISVFFDLKSYAFVSVIGYLVGMVEIYLGPLGYVSLGAIGGCLLISIWFGSIGKLGPFRFRMDTKVLGTIRDLTLASYIGMIGLTYGHQVIEALIGSGVYLAVASLVIALLCVGVGYLLGRHVFGLNWILLSGAICGGMTSTPGLGMAVDSANCDDPAAGYAATYPFALICMVLFTNIMYQI